MSQPVTPGSPAALINRELSWLGFARRVLALAEDPEQPLLERVKFAGCGARRCGRVAYGGPAAGSARSSLPAPRFPALSSFLPAGLDAFVPAGVEAIVGSERWRDDHAAAGGWLGRLAVGERLAASPAPPVPAGPAPRPLRHRSAAGQRRC